MSYTAWCFDIHKHCETIRIMRINISITSHSYLYIFVVRTLKPSSLSKLQECNKILSSFLFVCEEYFVKSVFLLFVKNFMFYWNFFSSWLICPSIFFPCYLSRFKIYHREPIVDDNKILMTILTVGGTNIY